MVAPKQYPTTGWYLELRDSKSNKFYEIIVSEYNSCTLRWGRIGSAGQSTTTRHSSLEEARDVGLRQLYQKRAKGYTERFGDHKFLANVPSLDAALRGQPGHLSAEFHTSMREGQYDGGKQVVLQQYAEFAEQAKRLVDEAAVGNLDDALASYDQLEKAWAEIQERHDEVVVAMQIAKGTMAKRLFA